jgi:hypothetical protein
MLTGERSGWRRKRRGRRAARIMVPLAIPLALALTLGVILAVSNGGPVSRLTDAALGDCASPSATPSNTPSNTPSPAGSAAALSGSPTSATQSPTPTPTPCPSGSAATAAGAGATASPSASASGPVVAVRPNTFGTGPIAFGQLGDVAMNPVDGQGNAINLNQNADEATASMNCTLQVPANPLTAQGLATPYQLGDGCDEATATEAAFVEATILQPNGQLQVYNPLVITQGTTPAAAPVVPTIPRGSVVILDFGFNGTNLVLTGQGATQRGSGCVDAYGQSVFGQVSACNATRFYQAADAMMGFGGGGRSGFGGFGARGGRLRAPALGTAQDGKACQTARDFALVDQDQSDNVNSQYLLTANGQTAQNTAANKAALNGATPIANGSDNALLAFFVDPANGCTPFTATDATAADGTSPSQALNELSARANQQNPAAYVPPNDEMTLVGGKPSVAKTNVYRSLVDQPLLPANVNTTEVAAAYCMNMANTAPARNMLDMAQDGAFASPVPAVGSNLATFLGNRLSMSFTNLGCQSFGLTDPVTVTADGNGVATAVAYNTKQQQATIPASAAGNGNGNGMGNGGFGSGFGGHGWFPGHRGGGRFDNPSHM